MSERARHPSHDGHDHAHHDHTGHAHDHAGTEPEPSGWFAPIDAYCERVGAGLFDEPLNAITNFAFLVGAVYLWRRSKADPHPGESRMLAVLLFLLGLGSLAFHTWAVRLTAILDTLGIVVFVTAFLVVAARRVMGWSARGAGGVIAGWVALSIGMGSICGGATCAYLPSVASAGLLGLVTRRARPTASKLFFVACGVLVASLVFRAIDLPLCELNPHGTHFLWHLCNAVTLCGRALARACAESEAAESAGVPDQSANGSA
ncbi:MAG: hypothetical protein AAF612_03305 [Planctomycetota bacterium]